MLKMLPRALLVAGVFALSSSAVLVGASYVVCFGDDTRRITYPGNAKRFKCGTQVGDTARAQLFENITVIGSPLVLSTPAEVDTAQAHLGIRFPTGYREYVTKLGEGVLGGRTFAFTHLTAFLVGPAITCSNGGSELVSTGFGIVGGMYSLRMRLFSPSSSVTR